MHATPGDFGGTSRFRTIEFVGQGAMGAVYRVFDADLGTEVALKTLNELEAERIYRLKNEFRLLAGLVHPNLVQLHDLVVTDDTCLFTMEFVDGVDFVSHVRGDPDATDEERLRRFLAAAPQLVRGLAAVHAARRLHRDVKPSNVRVAWNGRVVLLDFDLAAPIVGEEAITSWASAAAGSWAYMAPEQAWGMSLGPRADMYSLGVVFFEALSGRLPVEGTLQDLMHGKSVATMRLRELVPSVPEWLDALVSDLLSPTADQRPDTARTLARLSTTGSVAPAPAARHDRMVGRDAELARLREMTTPGEHAVVVQVSGPSGIGKSELLRRLLSDVASEGPIVLLQGRCHPQESVPYKALDPIVDALSRYLLELPDAQVEALLPRHAAELAKLFPVLRRVQALARIGAERAGGDLVEERRRGFGAFRELLATINDLSPVVVWIDDLQWADADSAMLIGELLRPPGEPPIRLLLSYRSEDRASLPLGPVLEELRVQHAGPRVHELALGPLDALAVRELAAELCPPELRSEEHLALLERQSGGSPFLLATMAWHLASRAATGAEPRSFALDEVVRERLEALSDHARHIVELVALAGGPIDRSVLLQASRQGEAGRPLVTRLEAEMLLRATTVAERPGVETYHDRFREAVVAQLDGAALAGRHHDLAIAHESSGRAEPEVLAQHFHGAGRSDRAATYAVAAADRAAEALAFARAAELYRQAREWDPRDPEWRRSLLSREGDALANAARFADGARAFLDAADGAPRREALELRRRASENLLAGGRLDEGVAVLSELLRDLGLAFPRTQAAALRGALVRIVDLLVRGIDRRALLASSSEDLLRFDTCYAASKGFVDTDPVRGVYFSLEALSRALRIGEPIRLGCALCVVGGSLRAIGGGLLVRRGTQMMERARAIAEETGSPLLVGTIAVASGQVYMLEGRWRKALAECDAGARLLAESCRGEAHASNIGRGMAQRAVEELGDTSELERRADELLQASAVARDRFAEVMASQHMSTVLLARDDPAGARSFARRGFGLTHADFHLQHLYALRQEALCALYEGRPLESYEALRGRWRQAQRAGLLRIALARVDAVAVRGRLALALAVSGRDTHALGRDCADAARRLERERRPDATVHALLLRAGLATLVDDGAGAARALQAAEEAATSADMALHAAAARHRRGALAGSRAGTALVDGALAALRRGGIRAPEPWLAMYAPGRWPLSAG